MAIHLFVSIVILLSAILPLVHLIVPPKTPVLSGFEPAAVGSYRELVCDASQPDAGTITYKWYKYSRDGLTGAEIWESNGPIGTSQKYVFNSGHVSGKYKCRASNSAGTRDSEWGDLYVYKPCSSYTVSVSPAKPAIIGSTFTLNCYIPNPSGFTVNWLKKVDASSAHLEASANVKGCHAPRHSRYSWSSCSPPSFSSTSRTFNLQVTNAKPSDSVYWVCTDISLSCESNPLKPIIQVLPGTPQITGFPSGPAVTAGTQLNLKCVASPPGDTYVWYKDGTNVITSLTYDFQVTKASAGVYKCVARNHVGSETSSDKTLVVYYKADSVVVSSGKASSHVGEKDKFTCTVSGGSPTPTLKIYFRRSGGTPVEVSQGQDRVMAKEDNQAEYYCEAKVTGYSALYMTSSRKTYNVTYPPTAKLSSSPSAVKEGDTVTLTCEASGGNPTVYTYIWYYSSQQIPNENSREFLISSIQLYTEREKYHCRVVNYSPGGIADASRKIDVQYKAKWDPKQPTALTVASKPNSPVMFTLHIIVNPRPTDVTWFHPNHKIATDGNFIPAKVNGTYTLSKGAVGSQDYGNFTVKVTNSVGISYFIFELLEPIPPRIPCCLETIRVTVASVTLTFKSNFNGGSQQQFTIERKHGNASERFNNIADPGFGKATMKNIAGLRSNLTYEFRVKADNEYGTSGYGDVIKVHTLTPGNIPNFTITRDGKLVTVVFGPLIKRYTRFQLSFCGPGQTTGCSGCFFYISNPAKTNYTIQVTHETTIYVFYLDFYDGDDVVYSSGPVQSQHTEQNTGIPAGRGHNGGMIAGVVVTVVILVAVVVVVVVVLHRRNMACFSGQSKPEGANQDDERAGTTHPQPVLHDPFYMNVDNRAFEGDGTLPSLGDGAQQESIYENGPKQQPVKGGDENPYDEMKNPYADLSITADVIAEQTYAELK